MIAISGLIADPGLRSGKQESSVKAVSQPQPKVSLPSMERVPRSQAKDQVVLSDQSRLLSKILPSDSGVDPKSVSLAEQSYYVKPAEEQPVQKSASAVEMLKYFPPFLSSTRRREILDNYPQLRNQINKMTVPPPLDLTYVLKGQETTVGQETAQTEKS